MTNIKSAKNSQNMVLEHADAFSVKYVLQCLAAVKFPYACNMLCHTCNTYLDYHSVNRPHLGKIACLPILKSRGEYVRGLVDRLYDLAESRTVTFCDWSFEQNMPAPHKIELGVKYMEMTKWEWSQQESLHILKEDLMQICTQEEVNLILKENSYLPNALIIESNNFDSKIPGKMPNVRIGQLAVKAAWQSECGNNKKATASEVIKILQSWVETEDILMSIKPHGVEWCTSNSTTSIYDVKTCRKTLSVWNKSRTS